MRQRGLGSLGMRQGDPRREFFDLLAEAAHIERLARDDTSSRSVRAELDRLREQIAVLRPQVYAVTMIPPGSSLFSGAALLNVPTTVVRGDALFSEAAVPEVQAAIRDESAQILSGAILSAMQPPGCLRWRLQSGAWRLCESLASAAKPWFLGSIVGLLLCAPVALGFALLAPPPVNAPISSNGLMGGLIFASLFVGLTLPVGIAWWLVARISIRLTTLITNRENEPLIQIQRRGKLTPVVEDDLDGWAISVHPYRHTIKLRSRSELLRYTHRMGIRSDWSCVFLLGSRHAIMLGVARSEERLQDILDSLPEPLKALPHLNGCTIAIETTGEQSSRVWKPIIPSETLV